MPYELDRHITNLRIRRIRNKISRLTVLTKACIVFLHASFLHSVYPSLRISSLAMLSRNLIIYHTAQEFLSSVLILTSLLLSFTPYTPLPSLTIFPVPHPPLTPLPVHLSLFYSSPINKSINQSIFVLLQQNNS